MNLFDYPPPRVGEIWGHALGAKARITDNENEYVFIRFCQDSSEIKVPLDLFYSFYIRLK